MSNVFDKWNESIDTKGLREDIEEAKRGNTKTEYKEVPYGSYEVTLEKLELVASKKTGAPMVSAWFKIDVGDYKGQRIFYNQIVDEGFKIHINNEFLRAMCSDCLIEFVDYKQYNDLLLDIAENVQKKKYVFELAYNENKKGFKTFKIVNVFMD